MAKSINRVESEEDIYVPDEAIRYILSRYLLKRQTDGVPVIAGINPEVAETVLELFIEWANNNGYVKDGLLILGDKK